MAAWRDYYRNWATQPVSAHSTGAPSDPAHFQRIGAHIARILELNPSTDVVLDVGCASGMVSQQVATRCCRLVGIDFIEEMVRIGTAENRPANATYLVADAGRLPFRSASFDKVYCYNMINQLPDQAYARECIEELLRSVRPDGSVYVGNVMNRRRKLRYAVEIVRRGGDFKARFRDLAGVLLPPRLKKTIRRLLRLRSEREQMQSLWFHPRAFRDIAGRLGWECRVLEQPKELHASWFRFDMLFRPRTK